MIDFLTGYGIRLSDAVLLLLGVLLVAVLLQFISYILYRKRHRNLEREIKSLKDRPVSGESQKIHDKYRSFISHDFMGPLNSILSNSVEALKAIGREDSKESLRDLVENIIATATELDLHGRNFVDPKSDDVVLEHVRLAATIEDVMVLLENYCDAKGVVIQFKPAGPIRPILADRRKVKQILTNVIQNAVKYSGGAEVVRVELALYEKPEGGKEVHIDVTDWGIGIPEDKWASIFEPRIREDGLSEEGSGLGLYYARKYARQMAGDIILLHSTVRQPQSAERSGSTLRIIFPYRSVEIDQMETPSQTDSQAQSQ